MKHYIFLTTEGWTFAPCDANEPEPSVENCQMLGRAKGKDEQDALQNLLKENPWIVEAGFDPYEIFGYELAKKVG